ncbi:amidohydrolase family protein [Streptomyces sp. NPDC004629]|uniref:amidohydrolase family protein n=1 Tax=Streptomyces sp. NPDC004629 TaxID=3364705 RepID=UPI0036B5EB3D
MAQLRRPPTTDSPRHHRVPAEEPDPAPDRALQPHRRRPRRADRPRTAHHRAVRTVRHAARRKTDRLLRRPGRQRLCPPHPARRRDRRGRPVRLPAGSPRPPGAEQRVGPRDAVDVYTRGSAAASDEVSVKGTLAVGRLADLAVLDTDLTTAEPDALTEIRVRSTWVGGECVYTSHR